MDIALTNALRNHLSKEETERVVNAFHKELQLAFSSYSLDDIERLAINLLKWFNLIFYAYFNADDTEKMSNKNH